MDKTRAVADAVPGRRQIGAGLTVSLSTPINRRSAWRTPKRRESRKCWAASTFGKTGRTPADS